MYSIQGIFHPVTGEMGLVGAVEFSDKKVLGCSLPEFREWFFGVQQETGTFPLVKQLEAARSPEEAVKRYVQFAWSMGWNLKAYQGRRGFTKYPFAYLDVGQEYLVEGETTAGKVYKSVNATGRQYGYRFKGRNVDNGLLVKRIS